mmetsp:Transcript_84297/g.161157  ORF Transcript_84297/g.161157 Transcript_84297/m.161157 type:complete len:374 (+) Transcript_84297:72-1193(+)
MGVSHSCQCRGRDNEMVAEVDGTIAAEAEDDNPSHAESQKAGSGPSDAEPSPSEKVEDNHVAEPAVEADSVVMREELAPLQEDTKENCEDSITEAERSQVEEPKSPIAKPVSPNSKKPQEHSHSKSDKHPAQAGVAKASKKHSKSPKAGKSPKASANTAAKDPATKKPAAKKDDFIIFKGKDCFVGQDADCVKADSLDTCKQICRDRGYGSFCVWEGLACFRKQPAEECLANLQEVRKATLYVYDKDGKHRQGTAEDNRQEANSEDASSPKASRPASRRGTAFPGMERQTSGGKKDNFMVLKGKDCFVGQDADCLKTDNLDECKNLCQEKGYGAFAVWEGLACFRSQAAAECLANLQDVPLATLYINLGSNNK